MALTLFWWTCSMVMTQLIDHGKNLAPWDQKSVHIHIGLTQSSSLVKRMLLSPSKSPRYLHSASLINGMMLVFGGNSHNATSDNVGEKCFSPQFLSYEIDCDQWRILSDPTAPLILSGDPGRYGHSAQVYNNAMYIFGGFNGLMLNSLLKFTPGDCYHHTMQDECVKVSQSSLSFWNLILCNSKYPSIFRLNLVYVAFGTRRKTFVNHSQKIWGLSQAGMSFPEALHTINHGIMLHVRKIWSTVPTCVSGDIQTIWMSQNTEANSILVHFQTIYVSQLYREHLWLCLVWWLL